MSISPRMLLILILPLLIVNSFGASRVEKSLPKTVEIGTYLIPLMVESETEGVFINILKEISKRSKIKINLSVYPTARTLMYFKEGHIRGYFPALDVINSIEVNKSVNFYLKKDFIFYKEGLSLLSLESLEGKRVGLTLGYPYLKKLTDNKKIIQSYVNSDDQNMKKLALGRIDAFVVEEQSGLNSLKRTGVKGITYNEKEILYSHDVYFAFQKDPVGKLLARKFSQALNAMKKDGSLEKILQPTTR